MPRFFHVDRAGLLLPGQLLVMNPVALNAGTPPEFVAHANAMFPNGLSEHGRRYFLNSSIPAALAIADPKARGERVGDEMLELMFELTRRASYLDRPSRFESVFAWKTLAEAKAFRARGGNSAAKIVRVEADDAFRADMNLLSMATTLVVSYYSHQYWSGRRAPAANPTWEYLLRPPVRVVSVER